MKKPIDKKVNPRKKSVSVAIFCGVRGRKLLGKRNTRAPKPRIEKTDTAHMVAEVS